MYMYIDVYAFLEALAAQSIHKAVSEEILDRRSLAGTSHCDRAMGEQRNAVTEDDLVKIFRANLPEPNEKYYALSEMDKIVGHHETKPKDTVKRRQLYLLHKETKQITDVPNKNTITCKIICWI